LREVYLWITDRNVDGVIRKEWLDNDRGQVFLLTLWVFLEKLLDSFVAEILAPALDLLWSAITSLHDHPRGPMNLVVSSLVAF